MTNTGRFTKENAAENGRKGGKKTLRKYGRKHFSKLRLAKSNATT